MFRCYRLFLLLPMALYAQMAVAQKPPEFEKRIFVGSDGRMYVQKSLPLYLRVSTSADAGAPSFLLTSEQSSKYSNPFYLDSEGLNTLRTPWAVDTATKNMVIPQQEVVFEVYADGRPPMTSVRYNKGKILPQSNKIYLSGTVEIELKALDWLSGVQKIMYSIDNNPYEEYKDAIRIKEEKEHILRYFSVDNVGNLEEVKRLTIIIDKSAPKARFKLAGDTSLFVLSGKSQIRLSAEDTSAGIAGLYYSINSGAFTAYEYPISTRSLSQGDYVLVYYAMDHLENKSIPDTLHFSIDKTPPVIVQEFIGKSFIANGKEYASGKTLVKFTSFDNKSGVKSIYYSVNDGEFEIYERPFYPPDQNGNMKIQFYAIDNVGNKSEIQGGQTAASAIPYVDLTGPILGYKFTGPVYKIGDTLFISQNTMIHLNARDEESGINRIEYRVDSGSYTVYEKAFNLSMDGRHSVHFVGYDEVDNTNQESFVAIVDTTGPVIAFTFSTSPRGIKNEGQVEIPIYPLNTLIFVSSTDRVTGFDRMLFRINNGPDLAFTGMVSPISKKGKYSLSISSFDKLGNKSVSSCEFYISDLK